MIIIHSQAPAIGISGKVRYFIQASIFAQGNKVTHGAQTIGKDTKLIVLVMGPWLQIRNMLIPEAQKVQEDKYINILEYPLLLPFLGQFPVSMTKS